MQISLLTTLNNWKPWNTPKFKLPLLGITSSRKAKRIFFSRKPPRKSVNSGCNALEQNLYITSRNISSRMCSTNIWWMQIFSQESCFVSKMRKRKRLSFSFNTTSYKVRRLIKLQLPISRSTSFKKLRVVPKILKDLRIPRNNRSNSPKRGFLFLYSSSIFLALFF